MKSTHIPVAPNEDVLIRLRQLAATPKTLSLKDLEAARTDAHVLNYWHGCHHACLARFLKALDAEYTSRLTTFFPLLLDAARVASDKRGNSPLSIDNLRHIIDRIDAPTQPTAPVFKVGDYVTRTALAPSEVTGGVVISLQTCPSGSGRAVLVLEGQSAVYADYMRLMTADETRQHLLDSASKLGYVVGARAVYRRHYTGSITQVVAWIPGDGITSHHTSTLVSDAAKVGKPFVYVVLDSGARIVPLNDLTLAPEPTHYLYRVSMESLTVRRDLVGRGSLDDMTGWCRRLTSPHGAYAYQVYPTEMPTRQTV